MSLGPVDWLLVEFPGNKFTGEILPALAELVDGGLVRVLTLVVISKDAEGNVAASELTSLDEQEAAPFENAGIDLGDLLSEADVQIAGEALEPNSTAGLLVWENAWARKFVDGLRNADARLLDRGSIPAPVVQAALEGSGA